MPAALTTNSARIGPLSVSTPVTIALGLGDPGDGHALDDPGAVLAGAARERLRQVGRIDAPFVRDVEARDDVVDLGGGPHPPELGARDLLHRDAEATRERRLAPKPLEALRGRCRDQVADGPEPGRLARLGFERDAQVLRVAGHPQQRLGRHARRGDQPRGVPGGAGRELAPLEQHRVLPAQLGQVVRDGGADDATADDDDPCLVREWRLRLVHRIDPSAGAVHLRSGGLAPICRS